MANDLFRIVSLRHSKASVVESVPASAPDPRLVYRPLLEGQATVVVSPREAKLKELKDSYAELSNKVVQLETVQRAVVNAYMLEREDASAPIVRPTRRGLEARTNSPSVAPGGIIGAA
jgi:hypothetical protein